MINNTLSYNGFHHQVITMRAGEKEIPVGAPVSLSSNGECVPCSSGQRFIGICLCQREDLVSVQVEGYAEAGYIGAAPSYGFEKMSASDYSGVEVAADDTADTYRVIKLDQVNKTVGFIL